MRRIALLVVAAVLAGMLTVAAAPPDADAQGSRPSVANGVCVGIRGNGQRLFAHYGALARLVEDYGPISCAAGGSSGSITAFLVESIWANPDVHRCGRRACPAEERDARIALLLKSVVGLVDTGIGGDVQLIAALVDGVTGGDIEALLEGPSPQEGVDALIRLLDDLGPLVNPELIALLRNSPDPVFHALDIIDGLQKGLQFQVDDPRVFLRTSVIDFDRFAALLGRAGSFYAGYGPADRSATGAFLDACAQASDGLTWEQTAALPGPDDQPCGDAFGELFDDYRAAFELDGPSRVDDPVGRYVATFGVTGVLTGAAVDAWEQARAAWLAAAPIPFAPDFDDVLIGYWGQDRDLRRVGQRLGRDFDDLGSQKFFPLGPATWREVLKSSPAEPGFSPGVAVSAGAVSVGGWADPLRVNVLDALGARHSVAVNRRDGTGSFTIDTTALLGASSAELDALYALDDPASSFNVGLASAAGVWCTDWDAPPASDVDALFLDGYTAPFITRARFFTRGPDPYDNLAPDAEIVGCTPLG